MTLVRVDDVTEGLRSSEALASVVDMKGRRHSIRVEREFLSNVRGKPYISMGIIHIDPKSQAILVEFPHEPETGINRIWVKPEALDAPLEVLA